MAGHDGSRRDQRGSRVESPDEAEADQVERDRMFLLARRYRHIQRKKAAGGQSGPQADVPHGSGSALQSDVRARMEGHVGADLGAVRLHTGGESQRAASGFGARAFTVGGDVHFGDGEYDPGTKEGDRLLAHELTHVVQGQRSGVQRKADGEGGEEEEGVSQPHEPAEKEADAVGDHVADALHGDPGGGAEGQQPQAAPQEKAPAIGAKLQPGALMRASGPRPPAPSTAGKSSPPPGTDPTKQTVADIRAEARRKGGAAAQIFAQIDGDASTARVKNELFADAQALLKAGGDPLSALQQAITAKPLRYLCQGPEITDKAVQVEGGINRYMDLPGVYGYYLKAAYKAAVTDADEFVRRAANKQFDPYQHMDDTKPLSGKCPITWWSAGGALPGGVEMGQVKKEIHVEDSSYDKGAVRIEVSPEEFARMQKANGLHIYKPTAIDGAHQVGGGGAEALFKPATGGATWGLTKGGAKEAIMRPIPLGAFKSRRLIVPSSVPPASKAAGKGKA
ncbi:MAG: hypothetical protein JWN44_7221 [Myxococcales bacterium]|nr:hypothetical protein [Myxococcales bacterium]